MIIFEKRNLHHLWWYVFLIKEITLLVKGKEATVDATACLAFNAQFLKKYFLFVAVAFFFVT
jgi:hypothetical protein